MTRRSAFAATLPFLLLAACGGDAPSYERPLPVFADAGGERDCRCVTTGECAVAEAFEGQSEDRGFQCRWDDRAAGRATCTYESRSRQPQRGAAWSSWSRTTLSLRHTGDRGWCWTDRSSQNGLTTDAPPAKPPGRRPLDAARG